MSSPFPPGPPLDPAYLAQSRVPQILFGSIFPAVVATFFALARFYSRTILRRNWGWDDTWMLLGWLNGAIVLTVLNCALVYDGAGRHIEILSLPQIAMLARLGLTCRLAYTVSLLWTKLSICALYLRLFLERKDRIIIWAIAAYHVLFTIPLFFGLVFRCNPMRASWSIFVPGKCASFLPPLYASAILNILGDVALLAFIVPRLSILQISSRQRFILFGVMGLGVLTITAAIVRLILCVHEAATGDPDIPYTSYDVVIWTSVEVNTGLVCASVPAARPILRKFAPWFSMSGNGSERENSVVGTKELRSNFADGTTAVTELKTKSKSKVAESTNEFEMDLDLERASSNGRGMDGTSNRYMLNDVGGLTNGL